MWSWGVMLCELLTGQMPYATTYLTPAQIAMEVADEKLRPTFPKTLNPELQVLPAFQHFQPICHTALAPRCLLPAVSARRSASSLRLRGPPSASSQPLQCSSAAAPDDRARRRLPTAAPCMCCVCCTDAG